MESATITTDALRVVDGTGRAVTASVFRNATSNQALLVPREAWRDETHMEIPYRDGGSPLHGRLQQDGEVTIDELVKGITIALGNTSLGACLVVDKNGNGAITVDELATAVNNALNGCA